MPEPNGGSAEYSNTIRNLDGIGDLLENELLNKKFTEPDLTNSMESLNASVTPFRMFNGEYVSSVFHYYKTYTNIAFVNRDINKSESFFIQAEPPPALLPIPIFPTSSIIPHRHSLEVI
ncbi:hypothetical protein ACE1CI_12710 [Aerosakkonemataceae cyanobacterium BLCC-F50]|uniref:Uncharacterized protein n=1 Tax=Floridaenema flaviceps BLCC-F50 TaxID=3153642 RepID=A0ABV4XPZ0_9CYAN